MDLDAEPTPRADYPEPVSQPPPVQKSADGSGDRSFEAILNSVNFSDGGGGGVGVGGLSDRGERPAHASV